MQQNYVYSLPNYPFAVPNPNIPASCNDSCSVSSANSPPVSTSLYSTTATSSWVHTVPSLMPWMPDGSNMNPDPSIVRFSAPVTPLDPCTSKTATQWELLNNLGAGKSSANLRLKRRLELDNDYSEIRRMTPKKQFITEEKMAARMQEMHISNNYTVPLQNSPFGPYGCDFSKSEKTAKNLRDLESLLPPSDLSKSLALCNRSLVLSPEVKSLVEPEKLFAKTLLNHIERPTMAVVLWKPPNGCVENIMDSNQKKTDQSSNDSDNNEIPSSSSSSAPATSLPASMQEDNNNPGFSQSFLHGTLSGNISLPYVPDLQSSTDVSMEA